MNAAFTVKFILIKRIFLKLKKLTRKALFLPEDLISVYLEDSPTYTKEIFELNIPILGICYGSQLMMHLLGGKVEKAPGSRIRQNRSEC